MLLVLAAFDMIYEVYSETGSVRGIDSLRGIYSPDILFIEWETPNIDG